MREKINFRTDKTFFLLIVMLLCSIIITSCDEYDPYYYTEPPFDIEGKDTVTSASGSGLSYIIASQGSGEKPQVGDKVHMKLHYWGTRSGSSYYTIHTVRDLIDFYFIIGRTDLCEGIKEAALLMSKGAKYRIIVPPEIGYGADSFSADPITGLNSIPAYATIFYDIELVGFQQPAEIAPFDTTGLTIHEVKNDSVEYAYYIVEEGNGPNIEIGKKITMNYTGFLEDGTVFSSNVEFGDDFSFTLGKAEDRLLSSLEACLLHMRDKSKFKVIIQPEYGYGQKGKDAVPPNATLYFDIEILSFK